MRYLHLKFEKEVISLGRSSPYEIPESGDNWNAWPKKLMEPILDRKFKTPYVKITKFDNFWEIRALGPSSSKFP